MSAAKIAVPDLESVYRSHLDFVFRICSRYVRNTSEAEDLAQEVFVKLARKLEDFKGDSQLGTWIYRIAINCCLDHLRKCKREKHNLEDYLDSMVVRNLESCGERVLAKIELDRILGQLRPSLRQMLFLALAEGLTYREIGEIMGLTQSAVAKSVSRFLEKNPGRYAANSKSEADSRHPDLTLSKSGESERQKSTFGPRLD